MGTLTLDDVLDVEYPGTPHWADTGDYIAATIYEDDGNAILIASQRPEGWTTTRYRPGKGYVTDIAWRPDEPTLAVTTDEGDLLLLDPDTGSTSPLLSAPAGVSAPTWGPSGGLLAVNQAGNPSVVTPESGAVRTLDVPAYDRFLPGARMLAWDDAGDRLAFTFVDRETTQVGVVDVSDWTLSWRTTDRAATGAPMWLDDGRLLLDRVRNHGTVRELVAVETHGDETVLVAEADEERGTVSQGLPSVSPDGERIALTLPFDGWDHVHVVDTATGDRTQVTYGTFEDKGLADSAPQWLDEGHVVFASNRRERGQRQLYAADVRSGDVTPLVESTGTNVQPRPSPDGTQLAYVHADRTRSPELRVTDIQTTLDAAHDGTSRGQSTSPPVARLTESVVDAWPVDPIAPEHVTIESHDGLVIHAYLFDPRGHAVPADGTDLPAVVWVHGGPMRQMRDGWHPSRSYGLAYAAHQYLAQQGYVGLLVNYRGGIGYGREFRQAITEHYGHDEMRDVVAAAEYLKDQSAVDSDSVGIWGLSYGGYAVLQLLGTHPETFATGVNLAGIADLENFYDWAHETKYPAVTSNQEVVFGGGPWDARDAWNDASPITHMERYERPLYSFHGTDDRYVNVEQQDLLVDELLALDKPFEAEYYPDEGHVYSKRAVWKRTLEKVVAAFEDHL